MAIVRRPKATYDYIVVGSGAGGAPAAARLAEQGFKVLVLEQGEDKPSEYVEVPLLNGAASEDPAAASNYFVEHFESPELAKRDCKYDRQGGGIVYPRGTGRIGGSTEVNALIWVRADDDDWDEYARITGDDFWNAVNMRELLQLVEKNRYRPLLWLLDKLGRLLRIRALRNPRGHGFNGYIETRRGPFLLLFKDCQLLRIVFKTWLHSLRLGGFGDQLKRFLSVYDPNDNRVQGTEGLAITPLTVTRNGRRSGVRERLLDVQRRNPGRLHIRTGAKVDKILLNERCEATRVCYTLPDGSSHEEPIGREVILAAGAFETPAILMRSGIGPSNGLEKVRPGIKHRIERRGVGQRLHDRYEISVVTEMKRDFAVLDGVQFDVDLSDQHFAKWVDSGRGLYRMNGVAIAFQMKSRPGLPDPDLYIFCLPCNFQGYKRGYSREAVSKKNMCTWVVLHENKGDEEGFVELDSQNPAGPPKINFRYHTEDSPSVTDSQPLVEGVKKVRALISRYDELVKEEVFPGADAQGEALRVKIESNTWGHHANGSARMGKCDDPCAVVDGDLKVIGVRGIRISDASVFPRSPGSFIASAVVQVGEAAAIKAIAEARGQDPLDVTRMLLEGR